jgi:hypothetical protein
MPITSRIFGRENAEHYPLNPVQRLRHMQFARLEKSEKLSTDMLAPTCRSELAAVSKSIARLALWHSHLYRRADRVRTTGEALDFELSNRRGPCIDVRCCTFSQHRSAVQRVLIGEA